MTASFSPLEGSQMDDGPLLPASGEKVPAGG